MEAIRREAEATFNAPVAGVLPLSEEMLRLGSSDLFCRRYPDHPFTKGVRQILKSWWAESCRKIATISTN